MQYLFHFVFPFVVGTSLLSGCGSSRSLSDQDSSLLLQMEESACLGRCPVYKLSIYNNRMIEFTGKQYTLVGNTTDSLTTEEYQSIKSMIELDELMYTDRDNYEILDAPVSTITIYREDQPQRLSYQGDAPANFIALKDHLKNLALSREWIAGTLMQVGESYRQEIILELQEASDLESILEDFQEEQLTLIKQLSPGRPYYLCEITVAAGKEEALLDRVRSTKLVKLAQWNHQLEKRDP